MAVSKKGKRKLIYNEKVYYWGVIDDPDSPGYILSIVSDDKKLVLHYELNQFNADLIKPFIRVVSSPEAQPRMIRLFPPEGDESATPSLVIKIIACHGKMLGNS